MEDFVLGNITGVANIGAFLAHKRAQNNGKYSMEIIPREMSLVVTLLRTFYLKMMEFQMLSTKHYGAYKGIDEYFGEYADINMVWKAK